MLTVQWFALEAIIRSIYMEPALLCFVTIQSQPFFTQISSSKEIPFIDNYLLLWFFNFLVY